MRNGLIAVAALALAGCGGGGTGGDKPDRATLPLTYERSYGGYTGGVAELKIEPDGRGTLKGGPPGNGCQSEGTIDIRLEPSELARIEQLLPAAAEAKPRVREEPATEAPGLRLEAGDVELRYVGFDAEPAALRPLTAELDRFIEGHCVIVTP